MLRANRAQTIAAVAVGAAAATIVVANFGSQRVDSAHSKQGYGVAAPAEPVLPTQSPGAVAARAPSHRVQQSVSPSGMQQGLAAVIAQVRPAVVRVSAERATPVQRPMSGTRLLTPFRADGAWVGSGVIIDAAGHVLTSLQVVGTADVVRVALFRGGKKAFLANRIATDPQTGLVLLKLPFSGGAAHVTLGDSNRVRTGDLVLAVGSPFGLTETVTQGIVSMSRRRTVVEGLGVLDMIQTDTAINRGNCGGPLVNIAAEVIGVNVAIYSTDTTFSGVGFAIPSNYARAFYQRAVGRVI